MAEHLYPAHILDSVARGMYASDCLDVPELDPNEQPHPGYYEYAEAALQALWDASRVDDYAEVEQLPGNAVLQTRHGRPEFARTLRHLHDEDLYPLHIIHWGHP